MPYAFQVDLSSEEMHDLKKPDTIVIHDLLTGAVKGDDDDDDDDDMDDDDEDCDDDDETQSNLVLVSMPRVCSTMPLLIIMIKTVSA